MSNTEDTFLEDISDSDDEPSTEGEDERHEVNLDLLCPIIHISKEEEHKQAYYEFSRVVVFIRILGLPMEYYDRTILWRIGNSLGKIVKVDSNTLKSKEGSWGKMTTQWGKFAHVCIEIDLQKVLVSKFQLHGRTYNIEYEGLYLLCFDCGRYGHRKENCPVSFFNEETSPNPQQMEDQQPDKAQCQGNTTNGEIVIGATLHGGEEAHNHFGPWMLVQRTTRRKSGRWVPFPFPCNSKGYRRGWDM
ncbi:Zinc finger, CCHC-type [Sesbania bispinosa]|nr:Zinc finger, CCHC-type [Sesbania bispinosa]